MLRRFGQQLLGPDLVGPKSLGKLDYLPDVGPRLTRRLDHLVPALRASLRVTADALLLYPHGRGQYQVGRLGRHRWIRIGYDDGAIAASFDEGNLAVRLPMSEVRQWAQSGQVSILAEQSVGESQSLTLLVEKDFKCLSPGHHRPDEDDDDTFPHPDADSGAGC